MHTEEQAKQLWCPQARESQAESKYGLDAITVTNDGARCIAAVCMMWRWDLECGIKTGYCGLAGKP